MSGNDKNNPDVQEKSFDWSSTNLIRLAREIAFLSILVYLSYSFINGDIGISFGTKVLTASEIISIFLAFFAILLSAAFYYMSTQQSNLFYHNVHQFTKDTSEILGRLDEQVKHIGGRQTELKDTFEKNYAYNKSNGISQKKEEQLSEELEKKEGDLKEKERSLNQKIDSFIEKIESDEEKEKLKAELEKERAEINKLKSEMDQKTNQLHVIHRVKRQTKKLMMNMDIDQITNLRSSLMFKMLINESPRAYKEDLIKLGYILEDEDEIKASKNGMRFLREIRNEIMHQNNK